MTDKMPDVPRTVDVLMKDVPKELQESIERDAQRLLRLPLRMDKDVAKLLILLSKKPGEVTDVIYNLPGTLPTNVDLLIQSVQESLEFDELGGETIRGERLRTLTDWIDLFTPT